MRLLTTKVPLMFILMQYVDFCDTLCIRCHLSWRPRDTNVEADQITKFLVDGFDLNLRLPVSWSELDLSVLLPLLKYGNFRYDLDQVRRDGSAGAISTGPDSRSQFGADKVSLVFDGGGCAVSLGPPMCHTHSFLEECNVPNQIRCRLFIPKHPISCE